MQSADLPNGDDLALRRRLHLTWRWRVAIQRKMAPGIVVVVEVLGRVFLSPDPDSFFEGLAWHSQWCCRDEEGIVSFFTYQVCGHAPASE